MKRKWAVDYWENDPRSHKLNKVEKFILRAYALEHAQGNREMHGRFSPARDGNPFTPDQEYIDRIKKKRKRSFYQKALLKTLEKRRRFSLWA